MPMFDYKCADCGSVRESFTHHVEETRLCTCGGMMSRVFLPGKAPSVIGDECDVYIRHGLCHANGTPQRFTSKTDIARAAKAKGLTNLVEHKPAPGTDKNRNTQRWV